jgi:hypothetical protein
MAGKNPFTPCETRPLEEGTRAEIAARIQTAVNTDEIQQWQQGTPAEWALESLMIVRAQVYRLPASGEIGAPIPKRLELLFGLARVSGERDGQRCSKTPVIAHFDINLTLV